MILLATVTEHGLACTNTHSNSPKDNSIKNQFKKIDLATEEQTIESGVSLRTVPLVPFSHHHSTPSTVAVAALVQGERITVTSTPWLVIQRRALQALFRRVKKISGVLKNSGTEMRKVVPGLIAMFVKFCA
jgi:hypothetical protein